jgi:hypothetical protein
MKKLAMLFSASCIFTAFTNAQPDAVTNNKALSNLHQQASALKKEKSNDHKKTTAINNNQMSSILKEAFNNNFGNVPITQWERTVNFDEVSFSKDGQAFTAFYDNSTKLIGTTAEKTFTDLPSKAQLAINKRYRDYNVGDILFFDDNELNETDMVLYNQPFEDADNYFVELKKGNRKIVVEVNMKGDVSYFTRLK